MAQYVSTSTQQCDTPLLPLPICTANVALKQENLAAATPHGSRLFLTCGLSSIENFFVISHNMQTEQRFTMEPGLSTRHLVGLQKVITV